MRSALTLATLSTAQLTNRCDDTVQDNCMVVDSQAPECKEFISSNEQGWTKTGVSAATVKCKEEGSRLMKISSLSDLARLGSDLKYGGHYVALNDHLVGGSFVSYDEVADGDIWVTNEPSGGEHCAQAVSLPSGAGDQPTANVHYLINDCGCEDHPRNYICERHVDTTLMACNHWMCPIVGGDVGVGAPSDERPHHPRVVRMHS